MTRCVRDEVLQAAKHSCLGAATVRPLSVSSASVVTTVGMQQRFCEYHRNNYTKSRCKLNHIASLHPADLPTRSVLSLAVLRESEAWWGDRSKSAQLCCSLRCALQLSAKRRSQLSLGVLVPVCSTRHGGKTEQVAAKLDRPCVCRAEVRTGRSVQTQSSRRTWMFGTVANVRTCRYLPSTYCDILCQNPRHCTLCTPYTYHNSPPP